MASMSSTTAHSVSSLACIVRLILSAAHRAIASSSNIIGLAPRLIGSTYPRLTHCLTVAVLTPTTAAASAMGRYVDTSPV